MAIKAGETTFYQAKRGIVQNGLVLNLDAGVDASYNGGTTWRDLEGGSNGALTNSPTFDRDKGGSIVFDGSDDYVDLGNVLDKERTDAFSISCWCYVQSTGTDAIFTKMVSNRGYAIFVRGGDELQFSLRNSGSNLIDIFTTSNPITANQWLNICCTYDGSSSSTGVILYVNSVSKSFTTNNNSLSATTSNSANCNIGRRDDSSQLPFEGSIATSLMYNRALTAAEVLQNYNATRHRFGV